MNRMLCKNRIPMYVRHQFVQLIFQLVVTCWQKWIITHISKHVCCVTVGIVKKKKLENVWWLGWIIIFSDRYLSQLNIGEYNIKSIFESMPLMKLNHDAIKRNC
jgi:hypothetical protein